VPINNTPSWFKREEYTDFLTESAILFTKEYELEWLCQQPFHVKNTEESSPSMFKHKFNELQENFIQSLFEAESKRTPLKRDKQKMRPEVNPANRERDRKRESRRQDGQTDIMSQIVVVKNNNSNKVEIILRSDFDKNIHTLVKGKLPKNDKGNVSRRDLTYYSGQDNFINTKTSIKLLGKIERAGNEKEESSDKNQAPPPPQVRAPKNGKEITDEFSTYPDWDHNVAQISSVLPDALNSLSGQQPSPEFQQAMDNSRTLGDSINRIVKEISKTFPEAASMTFSPAEPQYPTGQLWASMGIPESMPNVELIGISENSSMGVSVKIGEQIRPGLKGEAGMILISALSAIDPAELTQSFGLMLTDFVQDLRQDFSKNNIQSNQSTMTQQGALLLSKQRSQQEFISNRQQSLISKAGDLIEDYLNQNFALKTAFIQEAITGNSKFEGQVGSAQVMLSANKDGTDAKIIPLNPEFINGFAESDDSEMRLKFQAKPDSSGGFLQSLMQKINQINESALDVVIDIEKMKDQISNPQAFMQAFEIELVDAVFRRPLVYANYYTGDSDTSNTITIDSGTASEKQISIPVKYNFDQEGDVEDIIERGADSLMESYLLTNDYLVEQVNLGVLDVISALSIISEQFVLAEAKKRNYRREYDNYQGTAKQRANRSKRVLARRKMVKKGKVHKGDGKDVNHKDGNPQNNSINNLEPMSASKNRAMHEDHGAGFEGTDALREKFIKDTPGATDPVGTCNSPYSEFKKKLRKK